MVIGRFLQQPPKLPSGLVVLKVNLEKAIFTFVFLFVGVFIVIFFYYYYFFPPLESAFLPALCFLQSSTKSFFCQVNQEFFPLSELEHSLYFCLV